LGVHKFLNFWTSCGRSIEHRS